MGADMGNIAFAAGERRRYERLEVPQLYLRVGGRVYLTAEWSFGGFLLEDDHGIMPTGALVRIDGLADERTYKKKQTTVCCGYSRAGHSCDARATFGGVIMS